MQKVVDFLHMEGYLLHSAHAPLEIRLMGSARKAFMHILLRGF